MLINSTDELTRTRIQVQTDDFSLDAEMERMRKLPVNTGALASFVGLVREDDTRGDDGVTALELEHYPGMTEKSLETIVSEASKRWALDGVTVIHRVGRLYPGDQIVLVLTASAHRKDALGACDFIMDYLKTRAPFWKKEIRSDSAQWVAARKSDHAAARDWEED